MNSESMLERLDLYYQSQGIPAKNFNCKHRPACSAVCAPGQMVTAQAAYVGPMYEEGILPRLLFVSSDTSNPWFLGHPEWVTLEATRKTVLDDRLKNCKPSGHWYQTYEWARALLAPYAKKRLDKEVVIDGIAEFFAHTHSTRCKDASLGRKEGNKLMFANCRGFLKGEVDVMCPDIIVTQGARAKDAMWNAFPVIRRVPMPNNPHHKAFYEIVQLSDGHTAIKIVAWHPCAHWKRGAKKQFIDWAAKSVQEFIPVA